MRRDFIWHFFSLEVLFKRQGIFSVKKINAQTLVNQKIIIVVQCLECIGRQNGLYFPSHWRLTLVLTKRSDYIIFLLPKKAKILICVFLLNIDKDCFLLFLKEQVDFIWWFSIKGIVGWKIKLGKRHYNAKKSFFKVVSIKRKDYRNQVGGQ